MARTHIMIDSETLATSPNAAILTIGAVKFDPLGDELYVPEMESFYVKVDLDSCHELGLEVSTQQLSGGVNRMKKRRQKHSAKKVEYTSKKLSISCTSFVGVLKQFGHMVRHLTLCFAKMFLKKLKKLYRGSIGKPNVLEHCST